MKITFRGWRREVYPHTRELKPVKYEDNYKIIKNCNNLVWHDSKTVYAKIEEISLTGNYLVKIELNGEELESWLIQYVKENPEEALKLLSKLKGEAIIGLISQNASINL